MSNIRDIDVAVRIPDAVKFMKKHERYALALSILDAAGISKTCCFAVVKLRAKHKAEVWISVSSQSEEETIIEKDLEEDCEENEIVDCVGLSWCKKNNEHALYEKALEAFADYVCSWSEERKKNFERLA